MGLIVWDSAELFCETQPQASGQHLAKMLVGCSWCCINYWKQKYTVSVRMRWNWTDLGKCADQCNETQQNNSTQVLLTKKSSAVRGLTTKEARKRAEKELMYKTVFCLSSSVSLCFVALVSTFPQICSILSTSPAVVHSFLKWDGSYGTRVCVPVCMCVYGDFRTSLNCLHLWNML